MQKLPTLLLLLLAYAAATWQPGPGLWLRAVNLGTPAIQPPQVLLSLLLLSAGLCSSRGAWQAMLKNRLPFLAMVAAAWSLPLIAALTAVAILWGAFGCPPRVALGIIIVASMPVANSSVGWSASLGGSVALSIGLLVIGTALTPLLTPLAINTGAYFLGTAEQALTETPWSEGMGPFFLTWVLSPVVLGLLLARFMNDAVLQRIVPIARKSSFAILILLNYLNGAACLPAIADQPQLLAWPLMGSLCLFVVSLGLSRCFAHATLPPPDGGETGTDVSQMLSIVMRNTGAALVFAGAALPEYTSVSLTIIAYTMVQHVGVGFLLGHNASSTD